MRAEFAKLKTPKKMLAWLRDTLTQKQVGQGTLIANLDDDDDIDEITLQEFRHALEGVGIDLPPPSFEALFRAIDGDEAGVLSMSEVCVELFAMGIFKLCVTVGRDCGIRFCRS